MVLEIERKIIEFAVSAGKNALSEETGFLHFNPHKSEDEKSMSIPIYENILFVLLLLKTRKTDSIIEAKQLLEKLLSYQSESQTQGIGNFPVYLHEFPFCYSRWKAASIALPLYWCLKTFHPYLGVPLRDILAEKFKKLIAYLKTALEEEPADYVTTLKIGASIFAAGKLFEARDWEIEGGALLEALAAMGPQPIWYSKEGIGAILSSLEMVDSQGEGLWKEFWKHLKNSWHPKLQIYFGPAFDEWQKGEHCVQTLYDFYLSSMTNTIPAHLEQGISCLQAALITKYQNRLEGNPDTRLEGEIAATKWTTIFNDSFSSSLISVGRKPDPAYAKGLHPFFLQWMAVADGLCSLSFEGGNYEAHSFEVTGGKFILSFKLPEQKKEEKKIESKDLAFYFAPRKMSKITVEGQFSTTFKLGERVVIETDPKVTLIFELKEGKGDFLGHLMPGNRPSQLNLKRGIESQAFDGQIFLRAIRKETPCLLQVTVTVSA